MIPLVLGRALTIQRFQQFQLDHGSYHVVGRLDHIVTGAAGLNLGQQFFVIGKTS
jgi:hypothetical protein